jgi:hypothetical protein
MMYVKILLVPYIEPCLFNLGEWCEGEYFCMLLLKKKIELFRMMDVTLFVSLGLNRPP